MKKAELAGTRKTWSALRQVLVVAVALVAAIGLNSCAPATGESKAFQESSTYQETSTQTKAASSSAIVSEKSAKEASPSAAKESKTWLQILCFSLAMANPAPTSCFA